MDYDSVTETVVVVSSLLSLAFLHSPFTVTNTEIYINIEHILFEPSNDEFTVKVAEKPEEVKALLEVGFEYVC